MSHTHHRTSTRAMRAWPHLYVARRGGASRRGNGNGFGFNGPTRRSRPTGLLLQRDRLTYDDELAPGEKVTRRREIRHREAAEVRRMISRGEY